MIILFGTAMSSLPSRLGRVSGTSSSMRKLLWRGRGDELVHEIHCRWVEVRHSSEVVSQRGGVEGRVK